MVGLFAAYTAGVALAFVDNGNYSYLTMPVMAIGTVVVFGLAGRDAYETAERAQVQNKALAAPASD